MPIYQVTVKFNFDNVMQGIREYPSPDIELAFKYFEKQANEEWGNYKIETITVESIPEEETVEHSV